MRMKLRFVLEGSILALMIAAAGCTKPSTDNGTATGGASGTSTGGQPGASGGNTGSGGARTTGAGGSATTGTGGSVTNGTGGSTTGATGGTTGTGGTIVGGAGGAGGAAIVQKLCATKTVVMNPVFLNFENYTGMGTMTAATYSTAFGGTTPNTGTAYAGIYSFGDGSATPVLSMVGGNPPSNWAAGLTVTQASAWGMAAAVWMGGCANATAYKGISFYVRGSSGTGMFSFNVSMESTQLPDATNPAGGGTCPGTSDTCKDPSKANIPLTADWTEVQILWADFTPGLSGTTSVVPNGDNISGLVWNVPLQYHLDPTVPADAAGPYIPIPGDLLINIDDVSFIQ
jgi:hypothetical protein